MTPSQPLILLVGGTGEVGSMVARKLTDRGARVRALVRDPDAATARLGPAVEIVRGDLHDPPSLVRALRGVDVASLATAPTPQLAEQEANFVDAAQDQGLRRLVKLSAVGNRLAPEAPVFGWHATSEVRLEKSGIAATVLRPTPFTSILRFDAPTVRAGNLPSIMGDARFSFIDPEDVADLTVAALTGDSYAGQAWDVGGPEALTYPQVAATLTSVLDRSVAYVGADEPTFRAGLPALMGDILVATAELARRGVFAVDDELTHRVLGRPGRDLASWIARNRHLFDPD